MTGEPFTDPNTPPAITESGISHIYLDNGYEIEEYEPMYEEVKWFRDSLGQLWVKFYERRYDRTGPVCQVWPALSVVSVIYPKPSRA